MQGRCGSGVGVRHLPWVLPELVLYRAVLTGVGLTASPIQGTNAAPALFVRKQSTLSSWSQTV